MRVIAVSAIGTLLVLAACAESPAPESDLPSAPGVITKAPPVPPACDFKAAATLGKDYLTLSSDRKMFSDYLTAAEAAALGTLARNDALFGVFQLIEDARAAGNVNAASIGANLILELANDCGTFIYSHQPTLANLTEALSGGAWAYRDDSEGTVATFDGGAAVWTADWNLWIGGRSMVYIAKLANADKPSIEQPVGTFAYRLGVLYDGETTGPTGEIIPATVGPHGQDDIAVFELCESAVNYNSKARVGRVSAGGAKTVLQTADIGDFCPGSADPSPSGVLGRALHNVIGFFTPTPLQARMFAPPGMAGGIGETSDLTGANAVSVNLCFGSVLCPTPNTFSVPNNVVGGNITVPVHAQGAGGTSLENVELTLTIDGNQGTNVTLTGTGCPGTAGTGCKLSTNEFGNVTFVVQLNKTGGYTLRVTSNFAGYDPAFILTNSFNIQQ